MNAMATGIAYPKVYQPAYMSDATQIFAASLASQPFPPPLDKALLNVKERFVEVQMAGLERIMSATNRRPARVRFPHPHSKLILCYHEKTARELLFHFLWFGEGGYRREVALDILFTASWFPYAD